MSRLNYFLKTRFFKVIILLISFIFMSIISLNIYIDYKLPNEERIKEINLQVPLKIYTSDYKLIGEFGEKRRTALKFNKIPDYYIKAVLAAEDDNFFNHKKNCRYC